jgi:hypothetical protein
MVEENTRILIRVGQLARTRRDPVLTAKADELIGAALRLRMNLLLVRACLGLKWLFPGSSMFMPDWEARYRYLLGSLFRVKQHYQQVLSEG